jgi:hypothetical protein
MTKRMSIARTTTFANKTSIEFAFSQLVHRTFH